MVQRNDPCWCGSEKKYKKCHLDPDQNKNKKSLVGNQKKEKKNPLCLSSEERQKMRFAGAFNAQLMDYIRPYMLPGITTNQIDKLVYDYTIQHGHIPACLGYHGFPKSLCTSVNEVVCHGIPDERALENGDIINIDLTTIVEGWHGDSSETFFVGEVSDEARFVTQISFDSLYHSIRAIRPGGRLGDIGIVIQNFAENNGCSVVRDYQGHGIGRTFHQAPSVPHFKDTFSANFILEPGICFTIEPMINAGTWEIVLDRKDKWTVRTKDKKLSAQFEHTILMTESGPEILTQTKLGPKEGHSFLRDGQAKPKSFGVLAKIRS